jgi:ParB family chromosome partitioning protein
MQKRRGLGTSLEKLLSNSSVTHEGQLKQLPIEQLQQGVYQPRLEFSQSALAELAESIRQQGVIQPILVHALAKDRFEIIAGERRWRAAQLAGLSEIPAIVRVVNDEAALAMALIENIQRENLNAMEEARALERLQVEFNLTHEQIGKAVGKSRVSVSNLLRLLDLHVDVKTMLERGDIDMGHARALLAVPQAKQKEIARTICDKAWSVRQTELFIRQWQAAKASAKSKPPTACADLTKLQQNLSEQLGAKVAFMHRASGKGKMVIEYHSLMELDGILNFFKKDTL